MNERTEKLQQYFRDNIGFIIITIACLIYISRGLIEISETGKSFLDIVIDGALAYFFGLIINRLFDLQGLLIGDKDSDVIKTKMAHALIVEKIAPSIDKLDDWCEEKNKEALKVARIKILSTAGLKYNECFDEFGIAKELNIDKNKLNSDIKEIKFNEKFKIKTYNKACRVKLTQLTTSALTSDGGKDDDPFYLGRTKKDYEKRSTIADIITKSLFLVVGGLYGARLVSNFSYGALIWTALQVVLFLIMGILKMYQSYMFIKDEHRGRVVAKIDQLTKFQAYINSNKTDDNTSNLILKEKIDVAEENI